MVVKAVSAALCTHFQVPSVLRLGYGPVQGLVQAAQEDTGLSGAIATAARTSTPSADDDPASTAGAASTASGGSVACWSALALTSTGEAVGHCAGQQGSSRVHTHIVLSSRLCGASCGPTDNTDLKRVGFHDSYSVYVLTQFTCCLLPQVHPSSQHMQAA